MAAGVPIEDISDLRDLMPIMKAIALTVGPRGEVVLHDLHAWDRPGSTIVWIENGQVTGRTGGRELRSSSIYFRNSCGELNRGGFLVKRAIDRVARALRISRVTAYAHLEEARASGVMTGGGTGERA